MAIRLYKAIALVKANEVVLWSQGLKYTDGEHA